jgi:desulfoferrodoxin (superoxide reductase-like protein)
MLPPLPALVERIPNTSERPTHPYHFIEWIQIFQVSDPPIADAKSQTQVVFGRFARFRSTAGVRISPSYSTVSA